MKGHLIVSAAVVGVFVVAGVLAMSYIGWWTLPLGAAVVVGAWLAGCCWHQDISLLPPVPGGGPGRGYARWHCHSCGATWAAGLESSTRPRALYIGYDQAKAGQAAARADKLERERRRLAIERAGLSRKAHEPREPKPTLAGPRPLKKCTVTVAAEADSASALTR